MNSTVRIFLLGFSILFAFSLFYSCSDDSSIAGNETELEEQVPSKIEIVSSPSSIKADSLFAISFNILDENGEIVDSPNIDISLEIEDQGNPDGVTANLFGPTENRISTGSVIIDSLLVDRPSSKIYIRISAENIPEVNTEPIRVEKAEYLETKKGITLNTTTNSDGMVEIYDAYSEAEISLTIKDSTNNNPVTNENIIYLSDGNAGWVFTTNENQDYLTNWDRVDLSSKSGKNKVEKSFEILTITMALTAIASVAGAGWAFWRQAKEDSEFFPDEVSLDKETISGSFEDLSDFLETKSYNKIHIGPNVLNKLGLESDAFMSYKSKHVYSSRGELENQLLELGLIEDGIYTWGIYKWEEWYETSAHVFHDIGKSGGAGPGAIANYRDIEEDVKVVYLMDVKSPSIFDECGDKLTDTEGNIYETVQIGDQCWMAENLNTSMYHDGTEIPNETNTDEWKDLSSGVWAYYNNDSSIGEIYGKLYNWHTVNNNRGLCPDGWVVPSDEDWIKIEEFLGGSDIAGGKMKVTGTEFWQSPNTGATNESGFSALPGGAQFAQGSGFYFLGEFGNWWSSSESAEYDDMAIRRILSHEEKSSVRTIKEKYFGYSVRCVLD